MVALGLLAAWVAAIPARAGDLEPMSPAVFYPGGVLGVQIGSSWSAAKHSAGLHSWSCPRGTKHRNAADEVCFFKTSGQVAGAAIHDGFMVRKGDRVVLIGTGIAIKNLDDPIAEGVMRAFQTEVHARFQQTGDDVLFVNMPERSLSAPEFAGFSQTAPVLLVEVEPEEHELAVLYGYLAPVNAFSALAAD
jgi:hypothetical protein